MRTCKSVRFPPYSRVKKRRHGPFGGKRTILFVRGSGGTQCAERVRLAEGVPTKHSVRTGKNQLYEETKDFLTPEVLLKMMKEQSRIKQSKNELKLYRSTHEFSTQATLSLQVRGKN